jgi:hypothetical protein
LSIFGRGNAPRATTKRQGRALFSFFQIQLLDNGFKRVCTESRILSRPQISAGIEGRH